MGQQLILSGLRRRSNDPIDSPTMQGTESAFVAQLLFFVWGRLNWLLKGLPGINRRFIV